MQKITFQQQWQVLHVTAFDTTGNRVPRKGEGAGVPTRQSPASTSDTLAVRESHSLTGKSRPGLERTSDSSHSATHRTKDRPVGRERTGGCQEELWRGRQLPPEAWPKQSQDGRVYTALRLEFASKTLPVFTMENGGCENGGNSIPSPSWVPETHLPLQWLLDAGLGEQKFNRALGKGSPCTESATPCLPQKKGKSRILKCPQKG